MQSRGQAGTEDCSPQPLPDSPDVVIAVPTFNASSTIGDTLDSLRRQTYPHIQVVVVDNASTDGTPDLVEQQHPWVDVRRHTDNAGAEGNFTRCFSVAPDAPLLGIYHADDVYSATMVERQVELLRNDSRLGIVFTQAETIDEHGRVVGRTPRFAHHLPGDVALLDFPRLLTGTFEAGNMIVCSSALARAEVWRHDVVTWDGARFGTAADVDVWLRAARSWLLGVITEPLMQYRLSAAQGTAKYLRGRTTRRDFLRVLESYAQSPESARLLEPRHLKALRRAVYRDDIVLAANHVTLGQPERALSLLRRRPELTSWRMLRIAAVHALLFTFLRVELRRPAGFIADRAADR